MIGYEDIDIEITWARMSVMDRLGQFIGQLEGDGKRIKDVRELPDSKLGRAFRVMYEESDAEC